MSTIVVRGTELGSQLQDILLAPDIAPGAEPSYQVCKTIYLYHPLGSKIAESPMKLAQSQKRKISVPNSPEELVRDQYLKQWATDGCDKHIFNTAALSRVYGIASLAAMTNKVSASEALDLKTLSKQDLAFNVYDPLNTSGSLVLNQNPGAFDFLHVTGIAVSGVPYHRSRTVSLMNGSPVFIGYTTSAFGYVGRSSYQRVLFQLKSYLQTMVTDDMVARKAGLLVAMMQQAGSIVTNLMARVGGFKRALLQEAMTNNVLQVGKDDKIESLNLQNLDGAASMARRNIIENIATGADMPAKLLLQESFAEGFGEGTEDAKYIAAFVDDVREWVDPLYQFLDPITQRRAWNPEFFEIVKAKFPGTYGSKSYDEAFYDWTNSFRAEWPSFLREPESERIKVEDVKFKAAVAVVELLLPHLDPSNKATTIQWLADNFNEQGMLFQNPLVLDYEALESYKPPQPMMGEGGEQGSEGPSVPGFPRADSTSRRALADYSRTADRYLADHGSVRQLPKRTTA